MHLILKHEKDKAVPFQCHHRSICLNNGPDPAPGPAHGENDSTVTRYVYFDDNVSANDGEYPVGALIVKESDNPGLTVHEFTAGTQAVFVK